MVVATGQHSTHLLTINTGSSSLKATLYGGDHADIRELMINVVRIGRADSRMAITDRHGAIRLDQREDLPDHAAALQALFAWFQHAQPLTGLRAVGHRVVHGGSHFSAPQLITPELVSTLQQLVPLAPDHLPQAVSAIQAVSRAYPAIPQVACFDTAFHRQMPRVAQLYALPRALTDAGIVRYGFHGLSYEYIMHALQTLDSGAAHGRVIIAHLGNGASMAAVRQGTSIDTTMGFTPTGGLMMGTRSGDLDPGVLLYLLATQGQSPAMLSTLLNQQSGLLGVSGSSADMQDLLSNEATDPHAAESIALFCYQAQKFLGALVAALGGLDTLVFTGGIGEHAAPIRTRICRGLEFLGIHLDPARNATDAMVISRADYPVVVRVIPTDEDQMIARHTDRLIASGGAHRV